MTVLWHTRVFLLFQKGRVKSFACLTPANIPLFHPNCHYPVTVTNNRCAHFSQYFNFRSITTSHVERSLPCLLVLESLCNWTSITEAPMNIYARLARESMVITNVIFVWVNKKTCLVTLTFRDSVVVVIASAYRLGRPE